MFRVIQMDAKGVAPGSQKLVVEKLLLIFHIAGLWGHMEELIVPNVQRINASAIGMINKWPLQMRDK